MKRSLTFFILLCSALEANPPIHQKVNVVTGDYCEVATDAENAVTVRRTYSNSDGWHFNLPMTKEQSSDAPPGVVTDYDKKNRLIWLANGSDHLIDIDWDKYPKSLDMNLASGVPLKYKLDKLNNDIAPTEFLITDVLSQSTEIYTYEYIDHPFLKIKLLTKVERPNGGYCINSYYDTKTNSVGDKTVIIDDPVRDPRIGRVKLQKGPVGADNSPVTTARYFYHPSHTEVLDALDRKTIYRFLPDGNFTAIEEYDGNSIYRTQRFYWQKNTKDPSNLTSKVWEDGSGTALMCRTYIYDDKGNITQNTLYGNISGNCKAHLNIGEDGIPRNPGIDSYSKWYTYDSKGNVITASEDNGKVTHYQYNAASQKTAELIVDSTTIMLRRFFEYDSADRLLKITIDDGNTRDINDLQGVTQRHMTVFTYPMDKTLHEPELIEEHALDISTGNTIVKSKTHCNYDAGGQLIAKQMYYGDGSFKSSTAYKYDKFGRLTQELSNDITGYEKEYDLCGNLTLERILDKGAVVKEIKNTYDAAGRANQTDEIDHEGQLTKSSFKYNYACEKIETTDTFGNSVQFAYDDLGRLIRKTYPLVLDGSGKPIHPTVRTNYDIFNNVTEDTDANGHTTTTAYTICGKPYSRIYPDGSRESWVYNLDGTLKAYIDTIGVTTTYEHDIFGHETAIFVIDAATQIRHSLISTYTPFHLIKTVKDGQLTTLSQYNAVGSIIAKEQFFPEGSQKITYSYDIIGRLSSQTESWGSGENESLILEYVYNHEGKLSETIYKALSGNILKEVNTPQHPTDPNQRRHSIVKNSLGQFVPQIITTDQQDNVTTATYDAIGRIVSVIKTDAQSTMISSSELSYDPSSNKVQEVSAVNAGDARIDRWSYDPCNRVTMETIAANSPLERTTHYHYNGHGQLATIIKPDGTLITQTYSALGQLKDFYASDYSFKYHFYYNDRGNLIKAEDILQQTATNRQYNSFGCVIAEELGNGLKLSNTLDTINRPTMLHLPDDTAVAYAYDPLYLRDITRLSHKGKAIYSHKYTQYSLQGNILEMSLIGNTGHLSMHYDDKQRCRSIHTKQWSENIPVDGIDSYGNITAIHFNDPQGEWKPNFTYDSLNQLKSEEEDMTHTYSYDGRSNRIQDNLSTYSVDAIDQLNTIGDKDCYSYDLNGNLASKNIDGKLTLFRYDALDRLSEVEQPTECLATYTYDAYNRRISKSSSVWNSSTKQWVVSNQINYLYDGNKEIGTTDLNGRIKELRVLGIGVMNSGENTEIGASVALELNGKVYAPINDHRGNICCLVDSGTGDAAESYRYSAFGTTTIFTPQGDVGNPWQFSSKRLDPESGFVYYGKRYYDPQSSRWITKDPLGEFDGPNPYIFLHQSPMDSIDLYGLLSWSSAWKSTKNWITTTANYLESVRKKFSYTEYMREEWDNIAHNTFKAGFLHLSGYYENRLETGRTPFGEEINDNVRVTFINGILNVKSDLDTALSFFSETHGDTVIHYVFHPSEGWSKDICNSILAKFGYTTPYAKLLANKWKELIQELGGVEGGGTIIHYAHSIGVADTYMAKNLLTPEELKMIKVISLGSPSMIPNEGFSSTINYVSRRDGVCLLDPANYLKGWLDDSSNVEFVGSSWGIPLIEHTLYTESYGGLIRDLGAQFTGTYGR